MDELLRLYADRSRELSDLISPTGADVEGPAAVSAAAAGPPPGEVVGPPPGEAAAPIPETATPIPETATPPSADAALAEPLDPEVVLAASAQLVAAGRMKAATDAVTPEMRDALGAVAAEYAPGLYDLDDPASMKELIHGIASGRIPVSPGGAPGGAPGVVPPGAPGGIPGVGLPGIPGLPGGAGPPLVAGA